MKLKKILSAALLIMLSTPVAASATEITPAESTRSIKIERIAPTGTVKYSNFVGSFQFYKNYSAKKYYVDNHSSTYHADFVVTSYIESQQHGIKVKSQMAKDSRNSSASVSFLTGRATYSGAAGIAQRNSGKVVEKKNYWESF